ncbi:hypothetical protein BDA96_10G264700 [Sorghum bicolor]|uniref:Uncharacterized protein n=2 Tax=Sorghum bicolor TaxID=4558 RepID=A0A921Q4T8_SORBI|nr:hypothetical protein BDA96_10G264700 [Sorghum bicolor]KXG20461.1 hypothetical protein SORBI_3010G203400 [Sorghum bicolor]
MMPSTRGTLSCFSSSRCLASSQYMSPTVSTYISASSQSWISTTQGWLGAEPAAAAAAERRWAKKALLWERTSLWTLILTAMPSFP